MFPKVLSAAVLVALFARSVVADDCSRPYTVQPGDYCDLISRNNNVSTFQLAALNAGKYNSACTDLAIGAVVCLGTVPAEDCQTTYTVQQGDTCDAIVAAAGLNLTILYHNNPQIDSGCDNIYVGEVLCTAQTVQAPPTPSSGVVVPVTGPPANSPPASSSSSSPSASPPANNNGNNTPSPTPTLSAITVNPPAASGGYYDGDTSSSSYAPVPSGTDDDQLPYCDEI